MGERLAIQTGMAMLMMGLSGCLYQNVEVVAVNDLSKVQLSLQGMQALMDVDVYNPNPYGVTVTDANVNLFIHGEVVGDVTLMESQAIRPNAMATVSLQVITRDGALREVLKNDLMNLLGGGEVPFTADGFVTAKALGLSFTFPLKHDQTIKI